MLKIIPSFQEVPVDEKTIITNADGTISTALGGYVEKVEVPEDVRPPAADGPDARGRLRLAERPLALGGRR